MKAYIFIVMILVFLSPAFAEDSAQQGNASIRAQAQTTRGFDYINAGNYEKAARAFESATILNPENPDAYVGLSVSYWKRGDNEAMTNTQLVQKAVTAGRKALSLGADYPEVHATLGLCYIALNDRDSAIREYEILKVLKSDLADKLKKSIDHYKRPENYVQTGEKGTYIPQTRVQRPEDTYDSSTPIVSGNGRANTIPQSVERDTRGRKVYRDEGGSAIDAYDTRGKLTIDVPDEKKHRIPAEESNSGGTMNPRTGEFFPKSGDGGYINPRTGEFYPKSGGGAINPKTGEFFPTTGN